MVSKVTDESQAVAAVPAPSHRPQRTRPPPPPSPPLSSCPCARDRALLRSCRIFSPGDLDGDSTVHPLPLHALTPAASPQPFPSASPTSLEEEGDRSLDDKSSALLRSICRGLGVQCEDCGFMGAGQGLGVRVLAEKHLIFSRRVTIEAI